MFDIESGTAARFADGYDPSLAAGAGSILVRDHNSFVFLHASGSVQARVDAERVGSRGFVVSPSGDMIPAEIQRHVPFYAGGRLVLFHQDTPDVRHLLDEVFSYRVDWTVADAEVSNQLLQPTQ